MSYKTILVHVDESRHCPARVELAIRLAAQHAAHLVGMHAPTSAEIPSSMVIKAWESALESQRHEQAKQAASAEAAFSQAVKAAGLASSEWRSSFEQAAAVVTLHARYADIVVVGQRDPSEDYNLANDFVERVVLAAGRPVLAVPYAGRFATVGKRVLVAWNTSREATRALTDALPLLRLADRVDVVAIDPNRPDHGALPGGDIGLYLARHGVRVEVRPEYGETMDVGNALLSRAADFGADLIVMGAYGHSRLKELVMGGATRTIIDSMTVPVLMSH